MRIKEYTKGKHTYRRQGKVMEVERLREPVYDADLSDVEREIYATSGHLSFDKDRFLLQFGTSSGKIAFKTRMHYQSLKKLANDLSSSLAVSKGR